MIKNRYNDFQLFSFEEKYISLAKDILDKKYTTVLKLKDSARNFVAVIELQGKKYVLKEPRNEYRIPQRQFLSLFKDGEALSTLKNIHKLIHQYQFTEFVEVYTIGVKRKKGFIIDSFLLMEYIPGVIKNDASHKDRAVNLMKKIHEKGIYHGDFNPSNFIFDKDDNIHILDTKGDSFKFGNFRAHYDMITMNYDSYDEMVYPYKKDFFYSLAYALKIIKRNPILKKIKKTKKDLRDKGWKI